MSLIIFTDLDGSLLDHESYSYAPAQDALDALKAHNIPLILASSKTAAEISVLHSALELGALPAIVENGAGLYEGGEVRSDHYEKLRALLDDTPLQAYFEGFGDMPPERVSEITGLSLTQAQAAKARHFSEPGLWSGTPADARAFEEHLRAKGVHVKQGGRFMTLSFGATKADHIAAISARLGASFSVALGDAPNDIEMIEQADLGVIIRNDHGTQIPPLVGETEGRILRTKEQGPSGWNAAVLQILSTKI